MVSSFDSNWLTERERSENWPPMVGTTITSLSVVTLAGGASGNTSSVTCICPVSRFALCNCARMPCWTMSRMLASGPRD